MIDLLLRQDKGLNTIQSSQLCLLMHGSQKEKLVLDCILVSIGEDLLTLIQERHLLRTKRPSILTGHCFEIPLCHIEQQSLIHLVSNQQEYGRNNRNGH